MGQKCVSGEFGEFATPEVSRDDFFAGDPSRIDVSEFLNGLLRVATDQYAVGTMQILDRSAFGEEFRITKDVKGGSCFR